MLQLTIEQEFDTSLSTLFQAWINPAMIQKWFAPGDMFVPEAEVDARVGGKYRIVMQETDGSQHIVSGEYHNIELNERIDFSWRWQDSDITTLVTVLFKSNGDKGSSLELIHKEFVDQQSCDKHNMGWIACLDNLHKAI